MKRERSIVITSANMRELEARAVQNGTSYAALMEQAGRGCEEWILSSQFPCANDKTSTAYADRTVAIFCGRGNNGGDGFVLARVLHERFPLLTVYVVLVCGTPTASPADEMFERLVADETLHILSLAEWAQTDCVLSSCDVAVDAVYGIGFHGTLSQEIATLFSTVCATDAYKVSLDIPSGMHADSERVDENVFCPNTTITFTALKPCMILPRTAQRCGHLVVKEVGIERELTERFGSRVEILSDSIAQQYLPIRYRDVHKGSCGHVIALCGSYGMAGASMLAGKAALRSGIGLLHLCIPESIYPIVAAGLWEAVCHPLPETADHGLAATSLKILLSLSAKNERTAVLIGPGLSQNPKTTALIKKWLPSVDSPVVIDADGLNMLSSHIDMMNAIQERSAATIVTPHPGEAARLLGCDIDDVEADRFSAARRLAVMCGGVAVLKGAYTVIADVNGNAAFHPFACSGLATGGSGDVLAGMIAAFVAQRVDPFHAACLAVYLHGAAARQRCNKTCETSLLPTDVLDELPVLLSQFERRE